VSPVFELFSHDFFYFWSGSLFLGFSFSVFSESEHSVVPMTFSKLPHSLKQAPYLTPITVRDRASVIDYKPNRYRRTIVPGWL
jgi:hypothetical protein